MQKRFMVFCLSLYLLLVSSFAGAAPTQNLWDFLEDEGFDTTDNEVLSHVFAARQTKEALGVEITLEGLLYDGNTFLMGWRTENLRPLDPSLILYTKVTVDGEPIWTNVDHPLSHWYPRMFGLFEADDPINNLVDRFRLNTPEEYDLHGDVEITAYFTIKRPLKPLVVVDPEIHVSYDDNEDMERDFQAMIAAIQACGVLIASPDEQNISEWMEKGYIVLNRSGNCLEDDGSIVDMTSMYWGGDLRDSDCEKQEMEISFQVDLDMLLSGVDDQPTDDTGDGVAQLIAGWTDQYADSDAWALQTFYEQDTGPPRTHGLPDGSHLEMIAALRIGITTLLEYEELETIAMLKPIIYFIVRGEEPVWQITFLPEIDSGIESYTTYINAITGALEHLAIGGNG